MPKVDIREWHHLRPGDAEIGGGPHLGPDEGLKIHWTPAGFGGQRPWLACSTCQRHVMILYKVRDEWVCRRCGDLVYPSSRETYADRAFRKVHKIRERLGVSCDLTQPVLGPGKPKGMWWRTYNRLLQREEQAHQRVLWVMLAALPPAVQARILRSAASRTEPSEVGGVEPGSSGQS